MTDLFSKTYTYRHAWDGLTIIGSMVAVLFWLVDFLLGVYGIWHFRQYAIAAQDSDEALQSWSVKTEYLATLGEWSYYGVMIGFVISAILVVKWVYDSHRNARALGVQDIKYSPMLAALSFFIPIANWFMPFIAMRDMVNGSFEKAGKPTFHGLILAWWLCFVGGTWISRWYGRQADELERQYADGLGFEQSVEYLDKLAGIIAMLQIGTLLTLVSAATLMIIIKRTSRLHRIMHQRLTQAT